MTIHYENIDWNIDLQDRIEILSNNGISSALNNNLVIPRDKAFDIIIELDNLNSLLLLKQYKIISVSIVNTNPGIFGGIHVDKTQSGRPLELRLNIPLENSAAMINRWYNISNTPYPAINWDYQPNNLKKGDRWFLDNKDMMINQYCIDTMILTGPTFFKSSIPHNVDGSQSTLRRRILSIVFSNSKRGRIADWCERQEILDCITRL